MSYTYYSTISFPALGLELNPPRSISLGPLTIYLYGIVIALGLAAAVLYACKRSREFGLKQDDLLDGVLWVTPFSILCARAYYCAFTWNEYRDNPISVLYIWNGGLAIYGAVLGAIVGVIVFCRVKKLKLGAVLDIVALGFLIGQSAGRWGNFFNGEAFGGVPAENSLLYRFRMEVRQDTWYSTVTAHPTFFYESLWNLIGFLIINACYKKKRFDGEVFLWYITWYGFGRMFIEGLRTDSLYLGSIRISQLVAALCFIVGLALTLVFRIKAVKAGSYPVFVTAEASETAEKASSKPAEQAVESDYSSLLENDNGEKEPKKKDEPGDNTTDGTENK